MLNYKYMINSYLTSYYVNELWLAGLTNWPIGNTAYYSIFAKTFVHFFLLFEPIS